MQWIQLTEDKQIDEIINRSQTRPQAIFKHSTRCSISSVALSRLQKAEQPGEADFYYLDLIAFRSLSNKVAERFQVHHESPQVLVISKGSCIYDESHMAISMDEIAEQAKAA